MAAEPISLLPVPFANLTIILMVTAAISVASCCDPQEDYINGKLHKGIT